LRLFSLALTQDKDGKKTALFRSLTTTTLILSKKELSQGKIASIRDFTERNHFDLIYLPAPFTPNQFLQFKEPYYFNAVKKILDNKESFYDSYLFDVGKVTDDRPFYFHFFKPSEIKTLYSLLGKQWNPFFDSGFLLFFILLQAIFLALFFILLPLAFCKKTSVQIKISKKPLFYFFALGISYLFIEIVLIQKLILFLGHVIFSSTAVIFSMLFFSSLGALYSQRITIGKLKQIIGIIFVLALIYPFLLDKIIELLISSSLITKVLITILMIAPLGFFMGFPFPMGIRAIKKELIPWSWAVNGSASVLSPILAILIALSFGYRIVIIMAGVIYILGLLFILPKPFQSKEQNERR